MNEYYIYVYMDPRKPGQYNYDGYKLEYEPFYIGKGKKSRYLRHLKIKEWNPLKNNKILKIQKAGIEPIIRKIQNNLTNEEAIEIEIKLIREIGRIVDKTGPLTNYTKGGETFIGYKHKNDYIEKLNRPVVKYDIDGNFIEEYKSVKEAGEMNNTHPQTISQICNGDIKIWKNKFIFLYKEDKFEERIRNKKQYPVTRIDYLNNQTEYKSLTEASMYNKISLSKINQVCMGERFQTAGYLWRYKSHPKIDYFQSKIENNFGQYLILMDKEIKSEKDNKIYKNILHVIHDNKNVKINNLLSLIKSKKIFKYNEHKSSKKLF